MEKKTRFNLYQRETGIWYARFKNPDTGAWTSGKSTGESDRELAAAWAYHAIRYGVGERGERTAADVISTDTILHAIRNAERLDFTDAQRIVRALESRGLVVSAVAAGSEATRDTIEFLTEFWTWDASPYIREKVSRGHSISRQHAENRLSWIRKYWTPAFVGVMLVDLSRAAIRKFADSLAHTALAAQTRNHVLLAGTVALRWAFHNEILAHDLTAGLKTYSGGSEKRGTLTLAEVDRLFNHVTWPDERARLANLTAALSGMRAGEIAGLRLADIGEDRINVRHSWSRAGELKSTKTGESRAVPILPELRDALRALVAQSPHQPAGPGSFIFWTTTGADRPLTARMYALALDRALLALDGITDEELHAAERVKMARKAGDTPGAQDLKAWKSLTDSRERWRVRNVVFHGWRHFYASTLAGRLDARTVMSATGHRSESVFAAYADHLNAERFEKVAQAAGESFGTIVQFPGAKQ